MTDAVTFIGRDHKGFPVWQHQASGRVVGACGSYADAARAFTSVNITEHFTLDEYVRKFGLDRKATLNDR